MATATFTHPDPYNTGERELGDRSGQRVEVTYLDRAEYDREEIGPMFVVSFADGYVGHAFIDELSDVDGDLPNEPPEDENAWPRTCCRRPTPITPNGGAVRIEVHAMKRLLDTHVREDM